MQIFRTSRAQTVSSGSDSLPEPARAENVDPEIQQRIEGFFGEDPLAEEPVVPPNPFDLLFMGTPPAPGTAAAQGLPSVDQFAPTRVITVEEWLMANPDGIHFINLYVEKMEHILETRFIRRRDQLQEALNNGGMRPNEARVIQQLLEQIEASIVKMQQEIEKAQAKVAELNQVFVRELTEMRDLNGDRYIGDPLDPNKNFYMVAKHPGNQMEVILDSNGKVAVNPRLNPNYQPAVTDTESVHLIDRNLHDQLPPGEGHISFDEAFEIAGWRPEGWNDHTFGAQIDVSAVEGFWVEKGEDGEPLKVNDPLSGEQHYALKPFGIVTREGDNKEMYGQTPPSEEERDRYVFVKATDLEIFSEQVKHIEDANGELVDGGFVHYVFKDASGTPIARLRFQGVETRSHNPLVSDGTNYIAATTVGGAVNNGSIINEDGDEIFPGGEDPLSGENPTSGRWSYINVTAENFESTGKTIPGQTQEEFTAELGLPANINQRLQSYSDQRPEGNFGRIELPTENERAWVASGHTLYAATFGGNLEGTVIGDRMGGSKTAYLPDELEHAKTGIAVVGLRGNINTTEFIDYVVIPPPDMEAYKKMLPFAAEEIDAHSPAYATTVDAAGGRNIVISTGGDIYAKNATFFWREATPGRSGDQIYLDVSDVNRSAEGKNNAIFVHVGDANPAIVAIVNGDDYDQDDAEKELKDAGAPDDADPRVGASAANDDFFDVPGMTDFSTDANDLPDGLGSVGEGDSGGLLEQFNTTFQEAYDKLNSEIIRKDPLSEEFFADIGEWDLPPAVVKEDADADAFFEEWEFFTDQETDMSLDTMRQEQGL